MSEQPIVPSQPQRYQESFAPIVEKPPAFDQAIPSQPLPRPTREQMAAARARERGGVPFMLHEEPRGEILVKMASIADRVLWAGVPAALQQQVMSSFDEQRAAAKQRGGKADVRTLYEMIEGEEKAEALANGVAMAVVVDPKLVATEADLATSPDAWVVTDLHINDRKRLLEWVVGTRSEEDLARVAAFQRRHSGMEDPADR